MLRVVLGLLLLLLVCAPSGAAERAPVTLVQAIAALELPFRAGADQGVIDDFSATFFQESRIVSLDRVQTGEGTLTVKFDRTAEAASPRTLFRWEYTAPARQEIVSDGQQLFVYLPENRQVIQSDLSATRAAGADNPLTFLTGLGHLERLFTIAWGAPHQDAAGNYRLELRPRKPSAFFDHLLISVSRAALTPAVPPVFPLHSVTVIDPSGNSTRIAFSAVRINLGSKAQEFAFQIPEGVEVLRPPNGVVTP